MRFRIALIVLVAASLACGQRVLTPTPTPTAQPSPTASPTRTPVPTAEATASETETGGDVAIVRQPTVNVRDAAGGDPTGDYVVAGQEVTVLETVTMENGDEWVRIAEPAGWIFAGCLEGSERGCAAE
jgi:hypothetical protein